MPDDLIDRSTARARRRLLPFLLLMYVVAFLDRANIGFAKQAFQASTGISEAAYALGAGLFFLTYALLEIPSNILMHRIGARVWMCRIMVSWGLVSTATMFATGERSFYLLRLLLGAAEAGFFPGVILYLTYWFPNRKRGQILGLFYIGVPLALILGGPLSGLLLALQGRAGLQGWQWMFLVEGLLSVATGVCAYWYLDDNPANAAWLPAPEKQALLAEIAREEEQRKSLGAWSLRSGLLNPRVLYFSLLYFLVQIGAYGIIFYLPAELAALLRKSIGLEVGIVSTIPWLCTMAATLLMSRAADRRGNHRLFAVLALAASGLAGLVFPTSGPIVGLLALCVASAGIMSAQPLFWTFPTSYLSGTAAAGGIALINALGSLGGFVAPNARVWADRHFGFPNAGLYLLACVTLLNAALMAAVRGTARKSPSETR